MHRPRFFEISLSAFAIFPSASLNAESLKDFWTQRVPIASYASEKSELALEYCLGMAGSEDGMPNVLRGEGVTLVSIITPSSTTSAVMGFRISDKGGRPSIDVLARGSALGTWDRHSRRYVENCV